MVPIVMADLSVKTAQQEGVAMTLSWMVYPIFHLPRHIVQD